MNNEEKNILNFLLDTYERSKAFKNNTETSNRILMTFHGQGINHFKKYNIEDFDTRISYNNACINLKRNGLIEFEWLKGSENHIIWRAWLNKSCLESTYNLLCRMPKAKFVLSVIKLIDNAIDNCKEGWGFDCLLEWRQIIESKRSVGSFLPTDLSAIKEYLKIIYSISKLNNQEILERVFSKRVLGDSKKFEKMYRSRLISLLKKCICTDLDIDEMSNTEILAMVGIVKYPEQISFCGELNLMNEKGDIINFSLMINGSYINAKDVDMFKFKIGEKVDKIITIENKANYYDYISSRKNNNELVIYHGGCYSPSKALFFKKIVNVSNSKTTFFHWGDIDFGGFSMLKRLRLNINCDFKPYKMEKKDLIYNFSYTQSFSEMYAKKLQGLLDCDVLNDCKECIKYMLDKKVRLEQEIMI